MSEKISKRAIITILVLCNLAAGLLFFSWYRTQDVTVGERGRTEVRYAGTTPDGFWKQIDFTIFKKLNGSLRDNEMAQRIWAFANHRACDLISAACMGAVLWFGVIRKSGSAQKLEQIKVGLFLLITMIIFVQLLRMTLFDFYRPSASLEISDGIIRLTQLDHINWRVKDASGRSFPGDHGAVLLVGAVYISCFATVRWGILAFIVAFIFTLPRLVAGAHWATDVLVGSVFITLIAASWVMCLSHWRIGPDLFHRLAIIMMKMARQPLPQSSDPRP